MNKRRKRILSELKKIANHFRLRLSKIEVIKKTALALDASNNKLLVIDENNHPYFKTIDLSRVENCTLVVDYRSIDAGELAAKNMNEFIEKIQLNISHVDPLKSIDISFYDTKANTVHELDSLIKKATSWRDKITSILPENLQVSA